MLKALKLAGIVAVVAALQLGSVQAADMDKPVASRQAVMKLYRGLTQITPMRCYYGPHAKEPIKPSQTEPVDGAFCCRHDGPMRGRTCGR